MLRRDLSKIELKLEDLVELENHKNSKDRSTSTIDVKNDSSKELLDQVKIKKMVETRIGYHPKPRRAT